MLEARVTAIEGRLEKLDDRLRGVAIALAGINGKLDVLVAKVPSWWQQPVGIAGVIAAIAALVALLQHFGIMH